MKLLKDIKRAARSMFEVVLVASVLTMSQLRNDFMPQPGDE